VLPVVSADDESAMPLPGNPQTVFLGGLFVFAMLSMFYLASAIMLPVVLAFVLMLLLQPAVRFRAIFFCGASLKSCRALPKNGKRLIFRNRLRRISQPIWLRSP